MASIQISEIEQYAADLRAQEIHRVERRMAAAVRSALVAVSELLRPLFSWNPQRAKSSDKV